MTNYHRLGCLSTTQIYFSQCWSLKVQDQDAGMVLLRKPSELQKAVFSLCPRTALIPSMRVKPDHIPKVPPPNNIALGIRISTYEFGLGDTNIESIANRETRLSYKLWSTNYTCALIFKMMLCFPIIHIKFSFFWHIPIFLGIWL